jgi:hypothetical protein
LSCAGLKCFQPASIVLKALIVPTRLMPS